MAFLFRVGQSSTRKKKAPVIFDGCDEYTEPWVEPGLGPALATLTEHQRVAVVLVYGLSWTLREVADLTGTRVTTVQNHLERGDRQCVIRRRTPAGGSRRVSSPSASRHVPTLPRRDG